MLLDDCSDLLRPTDTENDSEEQATRDLILSYPHAFMLSCLTQQLHVALFFDMERHGRKVHAFVIPPHGAALHSLDDEATALITEAENEAITEDNQSQQLVASEQLVSSWYQFSGENQSAKNIGLRDFIIAQFIKDNLDVNEYGKICF